MKPWRAPKNSVRRRDSVRMKQRYARGETKHEAAAIHEPPTDRDLAPLRAFYWTHQFDSCPAVRSVLHPSSTSILLNVLFLIFYVLSTFFCTWQSRLGIGGSVGFPHGGLLHKSDWPEVCGNHVLFLLFCS